MRKLLQAKWEVLGLWLGSWIYFTRYAMLDDALIHLRYAAFLRQLHFITYDGVHASYGTSSLLYVSLLATSTDSSMGAPQRCYPLSSTSNIALRNILNSCFSQNDRLSP
jgi:hypothetical protein